MENKNKMWIWVLVIVVIAVVLFLVLKKDSIITTPIANTDTQVDTQADTQPDSNQDVSETTGVGAVSISYANALIKYADRRIQLDEKCQAYPNTVTYKDNTGIMFDNRSPDTLTVKVGSNFTIKPWGFKIVVLPNIYLTSKTLLVDCNESQNVATILVQE